MLGKNFNTNLAAIQGAFQFVDAHQYVQRRIMNDMMLGSVRLTPVHPEDQEFLDSNPTWVHEKRHVWRRVEDSLIDYDWYYQQYHGVRYVVLFIEWLKKFLSPDEEEATPEPATLTADADESFEFGGDYASQNST